MKVGTKSGVLGHGAPSWIMTFLSAAAVFTLIFGVIAVVGYLQPLEVMETVERLHYEHTGGFLYSVHSDPSILYPQEVIGPVGPSGTGDGGSVDAPPVFTRLARSIDLDFTYQLNSALPPKVSGEVSAILQIKAGEFLIKNDLLVPPTSFNGPAASVHASVDFRQIQDFVKIVEEQTGFNPGNYEILLVPTIHTAGTIGGTRIDEIYAPAFNMTLNQTQIKLDTELARTELKTIEEQVTRLNEMRLLAFSVPVMLLRLLGLVGGVICLVLTGILSAVMFLGLGMDEAARLKARYGGMIVSVSASDLGSGEKIQVASMQDLVHLAQKDGSVIFHQKNVGDSHLYFIPNGRVIYSYSVGAPKE